VEQHGRHAHERAARRGRACCLRAQLCALTRSAAVRAVHAALRAPAAFAALRERLQPLLVAATRALPQLPGDALARVPLAQPTDVANDERSALYLLTEVEGAACARARRRAAQERVAGGGSRWRPTAALAHTESLDSSRGAPAQDGAGGDAAASHRQHRRSRCWCSVSLASSRRTT
jgi:hypothetical protein